jgi:hypothetical protein
MPHRKAAAEAAAAAAAAAAVAAAERPQRVRKATSTPDEDGSATDSGEGDESVEEGVWHTNLTECRLCSYA